MPPHNYNNHNNLNCKQTLNKTKNEKENSNFTLVAKKLLLLINKIIQKIL